MLSRCSFLRAVHLYPHPNDSPWFWLKVLSKEKKLHFKGRENRTSEHTYILFCHCSWRPGDFWSSMLFILTRHAATVWKCSKCPEQLGKSLEVDKRWVYIICIQTICLWFLQYKPSLKGQWLFSEQSSFYSSWSGFQRNRSWAVLEE